MSIKTVLILLAPFNAIGYSQSLINGFPQLGIKTYINALDIPGTIQITDLEITREIAEEVDLIIFIDYNWHKNENPHTFTSSQFDTLIALNKPEKTVYLDMDELPWGNGEKIYARAREYCSRYFKRECYPQFGCIPLQISTIPTGQSCSFQPEKSIDIYCAFGMYNTFTGLRRECAQVCHRIHSEGKYRVVLAVQQPAEEYTANLRASYITLDAMGAGESNIRHLEIIGNRSVCFRQRFNISFPNDFGPNMVTEYSSMQELYDKLMIALEDKQELIRMSERAYDHYLLYHTEKALAQHVIDKSI